MIENTQRSKLSQCTRSDLHISVCWYDNSKNNINRFIYLFSVWYIPNLQFIWDVFWDVEHLSNIPTYVWKTMIVNYRDTISFIDSIRIRARVIQMENTNFTAALPAHEPISIIWFLNVRNSKWKVKFEDEWNRFGGMEPMVKYAISIIALEQLKGPVLMYRNRLTPYSTNVGVKKII